MQDFVHLNIHTNYYASYSVVKIKDLVLKAKELGMKYLAITDYGSMYGVLEFYECCKDNGIIPIIGVTLPYLSEKMLVKAKDIDFNIPTLILLAKNIAGYKNLAKLCSLLYESPKRHPLFAHKKTGHILDWRFVAESDVKKYAGNIICLYNIPAELSELNDNSNKADIITHINSLHHVFGADNFYYAIYRFLTTPSQGLFPTYPCLTASLNTERKQISI